LAMEPFVTAHATPVATDTFAANNSVVINHFNPEKAVGLFSVRPEIFFGPDDSCHTHGVRQWVAAVAPTKHCAGGLLIC
jgi:hypothetical protein